MSFRRGVRLLATACLVGVVASATAPGHGGAVRPPDASVPGERGRASVHHSTLANGSGWDGRRADASTDSSEPTGPRPPWMRRLDALVSGHPVSVAVGVDGEFLYRFRAPVRHPPASNQKLLLSMALLDELGEEFRIPTEAAADGPIENGVLDGDLWVLGGGDPEVGRGRLRVLASRVRRAGIARIRGRIVGGTGSFGRDWWAPGWQPFHPGRHIALPTALTFHSNRARGRAIRDPERRAAATLTTELEALGVRVDGPPRAGRPPAGLVPVAEVRSPALVDLLERQNVGSLNFHAEVLTKLLGEHAFGEPGTLAKGASAIEEWAGEQGVSVVSHDGSGLSYANEVSAGGMVRLLWEAEDEAWGAALRSTLPTPGEGTLRSRLAGVQVRAKTGTITIASSLSGWVWLERTGTWAAFSILSTAMPKHEAARLEDRILRILATAPDRTTAPAS